ncbi:hypothetical protein HL653_15790 [Sphingomonas sp. AP4-R1]|uniref:hypothetical protein n=1 Tax=Sphingomonas sp. AP4-R1 TaxID=2735134 RepID=UPI00149329FF|nr:hypothetical protein [Sphingomonas sp. AP4-R1]QJU59030.1 hypothetical protein HL653_15790 [Sphingomonas sp. AP4-R1]
MSLFQKLLCRFGIHVRSRKQAKRSEAGWKSVCRGCGRPMLKLKGGDWRVMLQPDGPTREERARQREAAARNRRMPPPRRKRPTER